MLNKIIFQIPAATVTRIPDVKDSMILKLKKLLEETKTKIMHLELKITTLEKSRSFGIHRFKERGGGQNFSTSFWMRSSQAPLCRYRFKFIFDDIIFLLSGNIIDYICF